MKQYSLARAVAFQVLYQVENDSEALAGETLSRLSSEANLSNEDGRLARTLVFGVLRTALTLDFLYGRFLSRGNTAKLTSAMRTILRLSAFQHYYLSRIPDYAIVNDAIEIARRIGRLQARELGFLNAVLRKVVADNAAPETLLPQGNKAGALSIRYSFPVDLVRLLIKKYGGQKSAEIMAQCNLEPPLTVRVNTLRCSRDELALRLQASGFTAEPGVIAPEALIVSSASEEGGGSLFDSELFREGFFYVQDEGSQMVARIAEPFAHDGALDLCAAPGGKTTHLAELTGGRIPIVATDTSQRRLELVRENITRLGTPGISVMPLDEVTHSVEADNQFGLVLVDAPCSGLGTVRRNPEIRYRITGDVLARHQQRQFDVLETAAKLTMPAGLILYSTCSISDQENRGVVEQFLKANPTWRFEGENATSATWPDYPQLDGFEAVVLRKGGL